MDSLIRNCHFRYKCPETWEALETTQDPQKRYCDTCDMDVYFCTTDEELREAVIKDRCVAIVNDKTDEDCIKRGVPHPGMFSDNDKESYGSDAEEPIPDFLIRKPQNHNDD